MIEELSQAVSRLQAQPLPQTLGTIPERVRSNASDYAVIPVPPHIYVENSQSLEPNIDIDVSLELLAKTINTLEAEIEDKLFAIWQGIAIRQVEDNFWGHPVPLDLIHEMGFSSMPMTEFLEFVGNLNDPTLEFLPSTKHINYTIGGVSAWYITFQA
ncbi:hypothetical protein Syn7502_02252 [Synechococcus sp. PCC 7502]|uniref:hypothetical protein n=1 Tax=Synechococcus sp. PCC 7502 TaxID=1173263 RepID=UPI00029F89BB|nr:hypothetical protein [Synechococcus sp. PCC 7502]AFY74260.1 hypothetical protein Syn7502_02252 [Synechococcus sp. PCC 7502]